VRPVPSWKLALSDDLELFRRIGRGDAAAYRVLVDREARYLYGIAHALSGNTADAEDLVQETFAGLLTSRFRGEASLRTWLVRILVRRAGMLRRSRRRRREQYLPHRNESLPPEVEARTALDCDARLDLTTMLQSLSPEHRAVIVLREIEGMSYTQIAEVLGVPQGTVESRLHRARAEIRRQFKGYL
jgi:RNA polymerase sigma-70 factor, ECF subfamily